MRIAFCWDWEPEYTQATTWQDGLAAALKELMARGHEVGVFTIGTPTTIVNQYFNIEVVADPVESIREFNPDVILHWADMTRPSAKPLLALNKPMALLFAGGEVLGDNVELFDHIFVESQVYEDKLKKKGYSVSRAFGTNTALFKPIPQQKKVFDVIFPGTFAEWKRHELFAYASVGLNALAVGYMYDSHESECWKVCLEQGVTVLPHTSHKVLHHLYAASKICVVTSKSEGGSQRTVLEAMSMDIPVIVTDSDKFDFAWKKVYETEPTVKSLREMINLALDSEAHTRDYVIQNWSEFTYADSIEAGLLKLV